MADVPAFDAPPDIRLVPTPQASAEPMGVAGAELAQGAARIGATMEEFNRKYQEARRTSEASSLVASNTKQLGDLEQKASLLDDHVAAVNQFNTGADQIRQRLANISDPFERAMVTSEFERETAMRQLSTSRAAFDREIEKHRGDLTTNLSTFSESYAQAGFSGNKPLQATLMDRAMNSIKAAEAAGWINGNESALMQKNWTSQSIMDDLKQQVDILRRKGDWRKIDELSADVENPAHYPGLLQDHRNSVDSYAQGWSYKLERREEMAQGRAMAASVRALSDLNFKMNAGDPDMPVYSDKQLEAMAIAGGQDPRVTIERYHLGFAYNRAANQFALTPMSDDQKILRDMRAAPAGIAAPAPGSPAFKIYRLQVQDRERAAKAAQAAYDAKTHALATDPVTYLITKSPEIAAAFSAGVQDPTKLKHAFDLIDAQLAHIGVAPQFRALLPRATAENIAYDLAHDPSGAPQKMANYQKALGGEYYGRMLHDLSKYGRLATAYSAIGTLDNHNDGALLGSFYGGLKPDKDGNVSIETSLLSEADRKLIKERIGKDPSVAQLVQSMSFAGGTVPYVTDFRDSIIALAYARMVNSPGESPASAADYAIKSFNGNRTFLDRNGAAYAPTPQYLATRNTADAIIEGLSPNNVQVPAEYGDVHKGLRPTDEYFHRLLGERGFLWTQSEDGNSWKLMDFARRYVRDKRGHIITIPVGGIPGMTPKEPDVSPEGLAEGIGGLTPGSTQGGG